MTRLFASLFLTCWMGAGGATAVWAGPLSLESFFKGRLAASGTVSNLRDGTTRDFTIDMQANWVGPRGTLIEDVAYADGQRERKVWVFDKIGEGRFSGRREDVTDTAEVVEDPQGVRMTYKAKTRVPPGLSLNLAFDDRLIAVSPNRVTVRSDVSYLFVSAAQITMTITKIGPK